MIKGSESSQPRTAHVPRLMTAALSSFSGAAARADAVSCEPTATTRIVPLPAGSMLRSIRPRTEGERMISPNRRRGIPISSSIRLDQSSLFASSIWLTLAWVCSFALTPHSRKLRKSGMNRMRSARARSGERPTTWASSLGRLDSSIPVMRYRSFSGMRRFISS